MNAVVRCKPWRHDLPPKKILVMRFQALGDTVITLPYLQSLKQQYPEIELHFLTRKEVSQIPKHISLFEKVIAIGGGRNAKIQFILCLLQLPWLWLQRYDAVLDLQHHKISIIIRKLLFTQAWAEFDRSSPLSAGERTRQTIEALFPWKINAATNFNFIIPSTVETLLSDNGWINNSRLVVLNPAGFSPSRNWPIKNYVEFANQWHARLTNTQFVLLLLPAQQEKATVIKAKLGNSCIDLTGKANQIEAFSILKKCKLVLSEDSGLMHMAWIQGTPTIALFSSSRRDWSAPQGGWSYCFDSSDMECGPCMLEVCKFGDNRCLTRYEPAEVLNKAFELTTQNQ